MAQYIIKDRLKLFARKHYGECNPDAGKDATCTNEDDEVSQQCDAERTAWYADQEKAKKDEAAADEAARVAEAQDRADKAAKKAAKKSKGGKKKKAKNTTGAAAPPVAQSSRSDGQSGALASHASDHGGGDGVSDAKQNETDGDAALVITPGSVVDSKNGDGDHTPAPAQQQLAKITSVMNTDDPTLEEAVKSFNNSFDEVGSSSTVMFNSREIDRDNTKHSGLTPVKIQQLNNDGTDHVRLCAQIDGKPTFLPLNGAFTFCAVELEGTKYQEAEAVSTEIVRGSDQCVDADKSRIFFSITYDRKLGQRKNVDAPLFMTLRQFLDGLMTGNMKLVGCNKRTDLHTEQNIAVALGQTEAALEQAADNDCVITGVKNKENHDDTEPVEGQQRRVSQRQKKKPDRMNIASPGTDKNKKSRGKRTQREIDSSDSDSEDTELSNQQSLKKRKIDNDKKERARVRSQLYRERQKEREAKTKEKEAKAREEALQERIRHLERERLTAEREVRTQQEANNRNRHQPPNMQQHASYSLAPSVYPSTPQALHQPQRQRSQDQYANYAVVASPGGDDGSYHSGQRQEWTNSVTCTNYFSVAGGQNFSNGGMIFNSPPPSRR